MPASACPGSLHQNSYVPAAGAVNVAVTVWPPFALVGAATPSAGAMKLWTVEPAFFSSTVTLWPAFARKVLGPNFIVSVIWLLTLPALALASPFGANGPGAGAAARVIGPGAVREPPGPAQPASASAETSTAPMWIVCMT